LKITQSRIARYLKKQKSINDYLLKISGKDREAIILLSQVRGLLLQGEQELRKLNEYLVKGGE